MRNDRSEAFCGSSGKILHLTFHQLAFSGEPSKPSDYKYKTKLLIKQLCYNKHAWSRHWSKLLLNAVLFLTNLKYEIRFSSNFRLVFVFHEIPYSNFRSVFAFHDFIAFPYSYFLAKFGFSRNFSVFYCRYLHFFGFLLSIILSFRFKIVIKLLISENCLWRFSV